MANAGFNGSAVIFASSTIGNLRGISFSKRYPRANVTDANDSEAYEVPGIPVKELTVDMVGGTGMPTATTGALTIAWNDGATLGALTNAAVVGSDVKGSMDGEITASITFCQMPA